MSSIPTVGFNVETVEYKNINCTVWDIGGQDKIRRLWNHYYDGTHGVIFVVDSNDVDRIDKARDEIHKMINNEMLRDAALLVYANKQDMPNAVSAAELSDKLGLNHLRGHRWYIQPCSATAGQGLFEGLDWLTKSMTDISNSSNRSTIQ